eukprot:m.45129 g.45129  ORF g.45129 m.45129 type:complete len:750 (+) comp13074_c0_seq1:34-2283(+)
MSTTKKMRLLLVVAVVLIPAFAIPSCRISSTVPVQAAITAAISNNLSSCLLLPGLHTLPATLLLPSHFSLVGSGRGNTILQLNITLATHSGLQRHGYNETSSYLGPSATGPLEAVVSCQTACSHVTLANVTLHGGLTPEGQASMSWQCGLGLGFDLTEPGFAGCHWFNAGVYLPPGSTRVLLQGVTIEHAAIGVDAVMATSVQLDDVTIARTGGFGFRLAAAVRMLACNNITMTKLLVEEGINNQGLLFLESTQLRVVDSVVKGSIGDNVILVNSSMTMHKTMLSEGLQCGLRVLNASHVLVTESTITNHSQVGLGGVCSTRSNVSIVDSTVQYNAFNVIAQATNLSLTQVECNWAFYTPLCADTPVTNANASCWPDAKSNDCKGNFPDKLTFSAHVSHLAGPKFPALLSPALTSNHISELTSVDVQACIDAAAAKAQQSGKHTTCQLEAGIYYANSTVWLRSNVTVQGATTGTTKLISNMSSDYITTCSQRSNCALLSVDNTSRLNIGLVGLHLQGGISSERRFAQRTSCGRVMFGNASVADTARCGYYEFGVLVTDYWTGGSPANFTMQNVEIQQCGMGIHVLGTSGVVFDGVDLHSNGVGNGFYHNAYFLRTSDLVVRHTMFRNATGHGLKLGPSIANVTLTNVTIADNEWQGIWLGDGVSNVSMTGIHVLRNWQNGLQLSDVTDLSVVDSVIEGQASAFHAGLRLDGAHQVVLRNVLLQGNGHGLQVEHSGAVTQQNVTDQPWYP